MMMEMIMNILFLWRQHENLKSFVYYPITVVQYNRLKQFEMLLIHIQQLWKKHHPIARFWTSYLVRYRCQRYAGSINLSLVW
jgi:hypothetical protein